MYELICAICARIYFHSMYYAIGKLVKFEFVYLFIIKLLQISMWCQILQRD